MRCPSCSKRFKSAGRLLQHLNQPFSRCYNWNDNLVRISGPSQVVPPPSHEDMDVTFEDTASVDCGIDADIQMGGHHHGSEASFGEEVEVYDGAALTWGIRETFMNQLDMDQYGTERAQNRYFPFASKPDWETAAFLLRSGLSMAGIDEYLNLEFVSSIQSKFFNICYLNIYLDQKTTPFV